MFAIGFWHNRTVISRIVTVLTFLFTSVYAVLTVIVFVTLSLEPAKFFMLFFSMIVLKMHDCLRSLKSIFSILLFITEL